MDGNNFDALTKRLARAGLSRRRLLGGLGGGLLTGALGLRGWQLAAGASCAGRCSRLPAGPARDQCLAACDQAAQVQATAEAEAQQARATAAADRCLPPGNTCGRSAQCCAGSTCQNGQCVLGTQPPGCSTPGGNCATNQDCCSGNTCCGGTCQTCCPDCTGKACGASDGCGGICQTGSCPAEQTCVNGFCTCASGSPCAGGCCGSGEVCCNGACVEGTCCSDNDCNSYNCEICENHTCVTACSGTTPACNGNGTCVCSGDSCGPCLQCVNAQCSPANDGGLCPLSGGGTGKCSDGTCVPTNLYCPPGADYCISTMPCSNNPDACNCATDIDGSGVCVSLNVTGAMCVDCTSDAQCAELGFPGSACVTKVCCEYESGTPTGCFPRC